MRSYGKKTNNFIQCRIKRTYGLEIIVYNESAKTKKELIQMAFDRIGYVASPCLKCESRILGCHSHCQKYQSFQVECERAKAEKNKDKVLIYQPQTFLKSVV